MSNSPAISQKMPPGIPYIIGNEAAERFSFYGMKAILMVFMTQHLVNSDGQLAVMSDEQANVWYHAFSTANYFLPLFGALIADIFWGKYKTIIILSIVYCLGHLALAMDETTLGLGLGLSLIAIGAGGIKPCVSAHVGDQFSSKNETLLDKIFGWFYISINVGAFLSALITPYLLEHYGPSVAFGVPGILMLLATIIFWMGRNRYRSMEPVGTQQYFSDLLTPEGKKAILNLAPIYLCAALFWSLFEQTGSKWVQQATLMDRNVNLGFYQFELLEGQMNAVNPAFILLLIPIFTYIFYPVINKHLNFSALRKIGVGMILAGASFGVCALAEYKIQAGLKPTILYQFGAYVLLTAAEILISVTTLEFAYTQAPKSMKSFIMTYYLISISLGNVVAMLVNLFIQNDDGSLKLAGASYYWFFVGLTFIGALAFFALHYWYKEERYIVE